MSNFKPNFISYFDNNQDLGFSKFGLFLDKFGGPVVRYSFANVAMMGGELQHAFTDEWINFFNVTYKLELKPLLQGHAYRAGIFKKQTKDDGLFIDEKNKVVLLFVMKYNQVASDEANQYAYCDITLYIREEKDNVKELVDFLKLHELYTPPSTPEIKILGHGSHGFYTRNFSIQKAELDIAKNYNDDFGDIDTIIKEFIKTKNESGLIMLHGTPGTGKTFYIRHLIRWAIETNLDREVIYIPTSMSDRLADPAFVPFLTERIGATIIIEDAERVVQSREGGNSNAVADILNLTDGILGDAFKLKIILSFNMDVDKVDSALTRKGRLKAKYEFNKLTVEKSNILLKDLGKVGDTDEPLTLTDIYNWEDRDFTVRKECKVIEGFGASRL